MTATNLLAVAFLLILLNLGVYFAKHEKVERPKAQGYSLGLFKVVDGRMMEVRS